MLRQITKNRKSVEPVGLQFKPVLSVAEKARGLRRDTPLSVRGKIYLAL